MEEFSVCSKLSTVADSSKPSFWSVLVIVRNKRLKKLFEVSSCQMVNDVSGLALLSGQARNQLTCVVNLTILTLLTASVNLYFHASHYFFSLIAYGGCTPSVLTCARGVNEKIEIILPACQTLWPIAACPEEPLPLVKGSRFVAEQLATEKVGCQYLQTLRVSQNEIVGVISSKVIE